MANISGERKEKIYDVAKNDSRMTVSYVVVSNDSLGGGGFGEVFLVQKETTGEQPENQPSYAMKKIKKDGIINDKDKLHRVLTEIKIHRSLNNPYICKYEHSFEDKNSIYILMEYCEKKSLDDYLKQRKTLKEYEARFYMFQVLRALQYLRRQKVIHRDLTLANVFLKDYKTIKIGDFGLSYKETENEEKQGLMCGTQGYFTPESYTTKYSYKTDIFDFGVCIYHLMTGTTLFKDSVSSYESVRKGEIPYDDKVQFSSEAKDLFRKIFVLENQRIDLDNIYNHDFFNQGKGLIDVDFPDYFKLPFEEFERKIKALEKNIKMTNVSSFPRKNTLNKDENYPSFLTKKSLNEGNDNNSKNSRELGESVRNTGMASNKKLLVVNKNKNDLNTSTSENTEQDISNNMEKYNKKLRGSLKIKRNCEEDLSDKEGNNKSKGHKKITFNLSDDKKEKKDKDKNNISDSFKVENEVNLRDKLEQNLLILKKDKKDNIPENKNTDNEVNTFKLRQSTKSLGANLYDDKDGNNDNNDMISFKDENEIKNNKEKEDIYIKKIIEINEKYGIAYQLNNKDIGILFNDFTHITKFKKIKNLIYYLHSNKKQPKKIILPLKNDKNKDLVQKIYYLGYIVDELKRQKLKSKNNRKEKENEKNNSSNNSFDSKLIDENTEKHLHKNNIYLMKFKKNNYAYFFILSNKNIQIDFFDGTKVIFSCSPNKKIIYIDREGTISNFEIGINEDFSKFKCDNPKINKRIKYALKEIQK